MLEIKFFFVLCVGGGLIRMIKGKEILVEKIKKMKYIIMQFNKMIFKVFFQFKFDVSVEVVQFDMQIE